MTISQRRLSQLMSIPLGFSGFQPLSPEDRKYAPLIRAVWENTGPGGKNRCPSALDFARQSGFNFTVNYEKNTRLGRCGAHP
jgi:hypothetical protein